MSEGIRKPSKKYADQLEGRSMIVRKAAPFPVECVVRGYLSGSGWEEYRQKGSVCGIALPPSLRESDRLEEPDLYADYEGGRGA